MATRFYIKPPRKNEEYEKWHPNDWSQFKKNVKKATVIPNQEFIQGNFPVNEFALPNFFPMDGVDIGHVFVDGKKYNLTILLTPVSNVIVFNNTKYSLFIKKAE